MKKMKKLPRDEFGNLIESGAAYARVFDKIVAEIEAAHVWLSVEDIAIRSGGRPADVGDILIDLYYDDRVAAEGIARTVTRDSAADCNFARATKQTKNSTFSGRAIPASKLKPTG